MRWKRIEENWHHFKDSARQQWARLTGEHVDAMGGRREQLVGKVREVYGYSREQTEKQVDAWAKRVTALPPAM